MNFVNWHNDHFLQILLNQIYQNSLLASLLWIAIFFLLPSHRKVVQVLHALLVCISLALLCLYGTFTEAPFLGWVILGCLLITGLRLSLWAGECLGSNEDKTTSKKARPRLPARLSNWFIRDYFRADPRGVYWIDWQRARYGVGIERLPAQRRELLTDSFEKAIIGSTFWQKIIFPILDGLIRLHAWLPKFWKKKIQETAIPDRFTRSVLKKEIENAEKAMYGAFAGDSFGAYLERAVDPEVLDAEQKKAGLYARKRCRLSEAKIESDLFDTPHEPLNQDHEAAAVACFELWRFRKAYAPLWCNGSIETSAYSSHRESTSSGAEEESASSDAWLSEELLEIDEIDPLLEQKAQDVESEQESAVDDVMSGFGEEMPVESDGSSVEGIIKSHGTEDEPQESVQEEANVNEEGLPNESEVTSNQDAFLPDSMLEQTYEELTGDLIQASRFLEQYIDIKATGDFATDVRIVERLLDKPKLLQAAVRLLSIYCLRNDYSGKGVESGKIGVLTRLRSRFRDIPANDKRLVSVRAVFYDMYIDILSERGSYGTLRELFSHRTPQTPHQWHLLGDALAHTALQISDSSSLRNDRLREAASAYFRAQTKSFWTQRYAGLLLETDSALETMKLFNRFPVDIELKSPPAGTPTQTEKNQVGAQEKTRKQQLVTAPVDAAPKSVAVVTKPKVKTAKRNFSLKLLKPAKKSRIYTVGEFNDIKGMPIQMKASKNSLRVTVTGDGIQVKVNQKALVSNLQKLSVGDLIEIKQFLFEVVES